MDLRQRTYSGVCGKLLKDTDAVRILAISRNLGMTVNEYMEKVTHEEHLMRVAELAIDPYRDIARILGNICTVSAKINREYPYSDTNLIKEANYQETKQHTNMTETEYALLCAFVGKEQADRVLQQIRDRERSDN